jgi:hypothetical protein
MIFRDRDSLPQITCANLVGFYWWLNWWKILGSKLNLEGGLPFYIKFALFITFSSKMNLQDGLVIMVYFFTEI